VPSVYTLHSGTSTVMVWRDTSPSAAYARSHAYHDMHSLTLQRGRRRDQGASTCPWRVSECVHGRSHRGPSDTRRTPTDGLSSCSLPILHLFRPSTTVSVERSPPSSHISQPRARDTRERDSQARGPSICSAPIHTQARGPMQPVHTGTWAHAARSHKHVGPACSARSHKHVGPACSARSHRHVGPACSARSPARRRTISYPSCS